MRPLQVKILDKPYPSLFCAQVKFTEELPRRTNGEFNIET